MDRWRIEARENKISNTGVNGDIIIIKVINLKDPLNLPNNIDISIASQG